ncbi:holo-ACP synthase [Falsibacillus pallidus]|uniref:holo-ACP synthase n=1 Tax=Falsibacillus pallidus TaxID=493781 RepID=UPI003D95F755
MIKGIGMDIVELERIRHLEEKQPRFSGRVLTENEIRIYRGLNGQRRTEYLAGRFAAKEAFSKAWGSGIGKDLSFQDMETAYDEKGKPVFIKPIDKGVHLSITHSKEYAAAQVIIEETN